MIQANNVTLRLGKRALFEDVNIKFTEGNCYGLIGANGAGKSTFLKILSGEIEPSKGDVSITSGQRLSVLKQDHYQYDDHIVLDTVMMGNQRLYEIMKEKEALYAKEDFTDEDGFFCGTPEGTLGDRIDNNAALRGKSGVREALGMREDRRAARAAERRQREPRLFRRFDGKPRRGGHSEQHFNAAARRFLNHFVGSAG